MPGTHGCKRRFGVAVIHAYATFAAELSQDTGLMATSPLSPPSAMAMQLVTNDPPLALSIPKRWAVGASRIVRMAWSLHGQRGDGHEQRE